MTASPALIDRCLDYLLKHGVADLSLRPMAAKIGTSARMLVHHFGSKDDLIAAVMGKLREDLQRSFVVEADTSTAPDLMLRFWRQLTRKDRLPYFRLLLEVQILAIQNPRRYRRYLADTSRSWLKIVERSLPETSDRAFATLNTAVVDGLLLELLSSGDLRRTTRALSQYVALLHRTKRKRAK